MSGTNATISDFAYGPFDIQIHAGDYVTWNNEGATVHTVTASRGEFGSGSMRQGQSFEVQFNTPGVYPYFCEPHEFMRGIVSVYPSASATGAATPTTAAAFVAEDVVGRAEQPAALVPVLATVVAGAALAIGLRRLGHDGLRVLAVVATLATGVLHLQLRQAIDYPEPIGTLLVIESGGAAVLAAWLAVGPLRRRRVAVAIAVHAGALGALAITRTPIGLFGFHEFGWDPSPQLPLALTFGAVAITSLALGTVLRSRVSSAVA